MSLLQRNGWWHVRAKIDGRELMFSLRTKDRALAEVAAARFYDNRRARTVTAEWDQTVSEWTLDAQSWLRRTYRHMRDRSLRKGWGAPMSWQEFIGIVRASGGICAVTGLGFETDQPPGAPFSISIDRLDNSRGYAADNCRVVCLMANIAMRHWGEDVLFKLCVAYTAHVARFPGRKR